MAGLCRKDGGGGGGEGSGVDKFITKKKITVSH